MLTKIKKSFYFPLAFYFRFFAQMQLFFWKPRIIVLTGSSGKTTLLHLIEAQLQHKVKYSHRANSAFGIPFNILGLERKELTLSEWPYLILMAPVRAFKKPFREKIYVVEADCDRPFEGQFLGSLLKPEVTIWLSSSLTHSGNFTEAGNGKQVDEAVAFEFGNFLENTTSLAIVNGDSKLITDQLDRTKADKKLIVKKDLESYSLSKNQTEFKVDNVLYKLPVLLPEETFYSLSATKLLLDYLNLEIDPTYNKLTLPPGRSSVFSGIKNTTIIDSSYNSSLEALKSMLNLFKKYPAETKWAVIGDILEQGSNEKDEHEKIAKILAASKLDKIILIGPRVLKYTYPKLEKLVPASKIVQFDLPKDVLEYLKGNIQGKEAILFKGARFLEGVIEHLLADKADVSKLCRREKVWQERRKKWGL